MPEKHTTYLSAISAIRFTGAGMEHECYPLLVEAESAQQAAEQAMDTAKERWLRDDGWSDLRVAVTNVT